MRNIMIAFSVLVMLVSQQLFADAKADSIRAFLGGVESKHVWERWAWCNDNYVPKTQAAFNAEGVSLILLDTKEGTERKLLGGLSKGIDFIRISRSGKWASFVESKKTYIVNLTGTPERKILLEGAYYMAGAWWIDPTSKIEYVFAYDPSGHALYKVKINDNGTAALPGTKVPININTPEWNQYGMDWAYGVSADGKKLGAAFPWPNTKILDVASGNLLSRHAGGFGCQCNFAPDNSYRLFHCEGEHQGIMMFGTNLSVDTDFWFVNTSINLAGFPNPTEKVGMDFERPRWSNHAQYYTATYPMGDNWNAYCGLNECGIEELFMHDANWVKTQIDMSMVSQFYLGKFSADFKKQEKSISIGRDPRYLQYGGDSWICSGVTDGQPCPTTAASNAKLSSNVSMARFQQTGSSVIINTGSRAPSVIRISDAQGRVVRTWSGLGSWALDSRDLTAGAYMVSVTTGSRNETVRMPVAGSSR